MADPIDLHQMFTSVATATIHKLFTKIVVVRLLLTILWGNTIDKCVNMFQND